MHKLKSLRQALIDAIPQLNANPERLQMSVGGGNIDAARPPRSPLKSGMR